MAADKLLLDDEEIIVIDDQRSVSVTSAVDGSIMLMVEGPSEVVIVQVPRSDAEELFEILKRKLGR